jgi:hypothetical protein
VEGSAITIEEGVAIEFRVTAATADRFPTLDLGPAAAVGVPSVFQLKVDDKDLSYTGTEEQQLVRATGTRFAEICEEWVAVATESVDVETTELYCRIEVEGDVERGNETEEVLTSMVVRTKTIRAPVEAGTPVATDEPDRSGAVIAIVIIVVMVVVMVTIVVIVLIQNKESSPEETDEHKPLADSQSV